MTHRERLRDSTWPYVVTRWDGSYEEIAARYGATYVELVDANPGRLPATDAPEHPAGVPGTQIRFPVSHEHQDYEWERYRVAAGTTLQQVCERRNETPGRNHPSTSATEGSQAQGPPALSEGFYGVHYIRAPELTPEYLWGLLLNNHFRRQYFEENDPGEGMSAGVPPDQLPSLSLNVDSYLMIPWPPRATGRSILVAPSPEATQERDFGPSGDPDSCTTCGPVPDWVDELYVDYITPMAARVRQLRSDNRRYQRLVETYMEELGHLHVIDLLVGVMANEQNSSSVSTLQRRLEQIHGDFCDWMSRHSADLAERRMGGAVARRRQGTADCLLRKLQSDRFNHLVETAFIELEHVVNENETTRTRICGLVADVCAQVMRVASREQRLAQLIDNALEAHAAAAVPSRTRPVRGNNALETLMSLGSSNVGLPSPPIAYRAITVSNYATSVGTTLMGNLPGPPCLAGALLSLRLADDVRHIGGALRGGGSMRSIHATRLRQLATYAQLEQSELQRLIGAARTQRQVDELAERIAGRYQSGHGWCSALAIISFIGLIQAATDPPADPFSRDPSAWVTYAANVASGGANTFSGVIGMVIRFGEGGTAEGLCTALGKLGAVLLIVASSVEAVVHFTRGETADGFLALATAAGGILLLCPGPWAVAGAVIVTTTSIIQVIRAELEGSPDSRRAVKGLLESLRRQPRVRSVLRNDSWLRTRLSDFESFVDDCDEFTAVIEWTDQFRNPMRFQGSTSPRAALRELGVQSSVIDTFITQRTHQNFLIR